MQSNSHILKEIVDNRNGTWECENCQERPETIAHVMRGGYLQEILCSQCYTEKYPKEPIMLDKEVTE